jgi:hypothetical protein
MRAASQGKLTGLPGSFIALNYAMNWGNGPRAVA